MTSSLLNIGKSGLLAAQVGLSTTGHNISNANVTGYSRQTVLQGATPAQNLGNGFIGSGTEVTEVKRFYENFLATQVRAAQSTTSALDTYASQINQIDNLMADPSAGLSPALQDFFKGVQDVAANAGSTASRQALLSTADSLTGRFQSMDARLREISDGVNAEIVSNVGVINSYASQIAELNDSIAKLSGRLSQQPNDMLDQRDQLVNELNKYIKATVVPDSENRLTVSIGAGQPLVVGSQTFELGATGSLTDPNRMVVGYQSRNKVTVLADGELGGGSLGALLEFRTDTLDRVQNSLGRVALSLAVSFNNQHKLGQDQNGQMGQDFFSVKQPAISADFFNGSGSTAALSATISSDPVALGQLTASNYQVDFNGTDFSIKRLPDGSPIVITSSPQTVDGVDYTFDATQAAAGDRFLVRPTINAATDFHVLLTDRTKIAAAAPVRAGAAAPANTGNARITATGVDADYLPPSDPASTVALPLTLTYNGGILSGLPAGSVKVNGVDIGDPGGSLNYNDGDTLTFGGISATIAGTPGENDTYTIEENLGGVGDNRNAVLLGKLQTANVMEGGKATYQGAYAETVSFVGNKTREVQINGAASAALLTQTEASQQAVSGVNLDEEAANLLRYQQAYQACGKVMQVASQLFDVVLALGN